MNVSKQKISSSTYEYGESMTGASQRVGLIIVCWADAVISSYTGIGEVEEVEGGRVDEPSANEGCPDDESFPFDTDETWESTKGVVVYGRGSVAYDVDAEAKFGSK